MKRRRRVQLGNRAKSLRQMARGDGRFLPLHYENTTKPKTPAVNGTKGTTSSHGEAAACQQTPTNERLERLIQRHRECRWERYGLVLVHERGSYTLICIAKRSRWVPVWSLDWIDSETDHQWRVGNGRSGFLEISLAALVQMREGRGDKKVEGDRDGVMQKNGKIKWGKRP